jgi:predicted DNA-binding transcriptional regulator YafY
MRRIRMPAKKDPYATPGQKLLGLFALLLFTGKSYSLTNLAQMFQCSKQSVCRMVEDIERSHGAKVERLTEGRERLFRIVTPKEKPKVALTQEQIRQLVLCRDLVLHLLPEGMRDSLDSAIQKTTVLLPDMEERGEAFDSVVRVAVKGGIDYSPFQSTLSTLLVAMRERKVCEVSYRAVGKSEPRIHNLAPVRLLSYRESLYVQGWKVNDRGTVEALYPTTLAVHRTLDVTPTRRTFDLPEPEMPETGIFGILSGKPLKVKVRFTQTVAQYVRERTWSADQKVREQKDGGLELEFTAHSEGEVVSWVLSFCGNAKLISPKSLALRLLEEAENVRALYL